MGVASPHPPCEFQGPKSGQGQNSGHRAPLPSEPSAFTTITFTHHPLTTSNAPATYKLACYGCFISLRGLCSFVCVMLSRSIHTAVRIRTPLAVEGELAPIVHKHILLTIHLSIDTWVASSLSYCEERCGERWSALIYF